MPIISGVLKDGAGQSIAGCTIQLKAMNTTSAVIRSTTARVGANAGAYSIDAQPGRYEVTLAVEDYPPHKVGVIDVYADSPDGTLNDFLTATKAEYLTPDVMNQFKLLAQQAREAAEAANTASQVASTIKAVAEKAASNAVLSENSAADSALAAGASEINAAGSVLAARTSEINAAGSVAKAAASAAAALVSQNAAKTSEDAASASAVKASVSEVNAYYSAAAALASQNAAKVSEDAAKASQVASTASADSASASAMSAQGNATRSTQAATDAIAAKDAATAQVTGFDEYVSQQVTVITGVAASATTKANADIAAATDINRNNAIQAINQKQAEATGAIQASVDTAVTTAQTAALSASASQVAATASASGANTSAIAAQASATAAKVSENAAKSSEINALIGASATDISETSAAISASGALASKNAAKLSETAAALSELNIQQKASTIEFAFNKLAPLVMDPATGASVDISAKLSGFATRAEVAATNAETNNKGAQQALEEAKLIAKTPGKDGAPGLPGLPGKDGESAYQIWKESQPEGTDTSLTAYLAIYADVKNLRSTNIGGKSVPFILVEQIKQITDLPTGTFVEVQSVTGLLPLIDTAYLSVIANDFSSNRNAFVLYGKGSGRVWTGYRNDAAVSWKELGSSGSEGSGGAVPGFGEVGSYVWGIVQ